MSSMVFRKLTADLAQDTACGGKARGLARLLAAGARVPPAYVLDAADPADAARVAAEVQLPELPAGSRWAVRSSALAEDGPARSYAGLFHTALNVPPDEVRAAIAACIASGASAQVLAYAGQPQPVGVLLQQQIQPRAAGVCFTRDPLGADRALLIEAVPGRGDALVSGHREPERWRVYVNGLGRAEWQREGPAVLGVDEAAQLAEQARRLATAFATPLDLEWAISDAGVEWLQARPVTTLREPVDLRVEASFPGADNGAVSVWSNFNVRETMPRPMSRLNMSLWVHSILPTVAEPVFGLPAESPLLREVLPVDFVQGRLYWNMNAFLALPMGRLLMRHALALLDPQAQQIVIQLMDTGILRARRLPGSRLLNTARLLAASTVAMLRMQRTPSPERMLVELQAMADALRGRPPLATLTPAALVAELSLVRECQPMIVASRLMSRAIATFGIADWLYRHAPDARALLTAGLSGNPTTGISLALDELALAARPLRAAFVEPAGWEARLAAVAALPGGREWCARFDEFLTHNGQRCPAEFDLTQPRWHEDPTLPLELVRQAVLDAGHQPLADRLAALRERRTAAIDAALRASPAWKRPLMRALLRRLERIAPMREAPKHYGCTLSRACARRRWRSAGGCARTGAWTRPPRCSTSTWPNSRPGRAIPPRRFPVAMTSRRALPAGKPMPGWRRPTSGARTACRCGYRKPPAATACGTACRPAAGWRAGVCGCWPRPMPQRCGRVKCWSPNSPILAGRRCSRAQRPSSWKSADRCATPRWSHANSASRRCLHCAARASC